MKREDFMRQLERLLEGVAAEEKKEALSYYQSYFEDAGEENEERILKELESPEKVAATIKADLGMDGAAGQGEYTERGFEDSRFVQKNPIDIRKDTAGGRQGQPESQDSSGAGSSYGYSQGQPGTEGSYGYSQGQPGTEGSYGYSQGGSTGEGSQRYGSSGDSKAGGQGYSGAGRGSQNSYGNYSSNSGDGRSTYSGRSGMEILLIIIIAVVTSPVWIGLVTGGGGALLGIAIAAVCVAGSLFVAGFALAGIGIGQLATGSLPIGFALTGAGFLLLAVAVLAAILCVWMCGKFVPWVLRLIGKLWNSIFSGKEKRV